jgi:hypothetical protein
MNQHPPADHEGWMVSGRRKVLLGSSCLANHGCYVQLLFNYLPTYNLLTQLRLVHKWIITGTEWMVCWWVLVHSGYLSHGSVPNNRFVGLAYKAKILCLKFIIEYSSLRDFCP